MARGSVAKRCQCRDGDGRRVKDCRKAHGSWSFTVEAGRDELTGNRKQTAQGGFPTRREAEAAMAKVLADVENGTWSDDRGKTVGDWLAAWLDELADSDMSVKTLSSYRLHCRSVWIPRIGYLRLRDLRRTHIESALRELAQPTTTRRPGRKPPPPSVHCKALRKDGAPCSNWAVHADQRCARHGGVRQDIDLGDREAGNIGRRTSKRTASTVNGYRRTLRAALSAARRRGLVTQNVAEGRMDAIPREEDIEATIWEPDQTAKFLDHVATDRLAALYELAAYAGLRRAELCGLRWSDIDDDGGLQIEQTLIEVSVGQLQGIDRTCPTCGGDHGGRIFKRPKSRSGRRWIPLVPAAQAALAAHRLQQNAERDRLRAYVDHDLVFCELDGNPIRPSLVSDEFDRHITACGLPRIKLHETRHGAASLLLSGGVPIEVVQMILGHSSPAVLRQVYRHVMKKATAAQVAAATDSLTRHRRAPSSGDDGPSTELDTGR